MRFPMDHLTQALAVLDAVLEEPNLTVFARLDLKIVELEILDLTGPVLQEQAATIDGPADGIRRAVELLDNASLLTESPALAVSVAIARRRLAALLDHPLTDEPT